MTLTPAGLVDALSALTGLGKPTLIDIDRKLATAGLRTKGGRGLSAAQMTALDAARLLTAILTERQSNNSASSVQRYEDTLPDPARSSDGLFAASGLEDLAALPARHGFVEALAALIDSAGTGALRQVIALGGKPRIELFAFMRATYGRIRIYTLPGERSAHVEYLPAARMRPLHKTIASNASANQTEGDLEQSNRLTERTILSIAELLAEENNNERG